MIFQFVYIVITLALICGFATTVISAITLAENYYYSIKIEYSIVILTLTGLLGVFISLISAYMINVNLKKKVLANLIVFVLVTCSLLLVLISLGNSFFYLYCGKIIEYPFENNSLDLKNRVFHIS